MEQDPPESQTKAEMIDFAIGFLNFCNKNKKWDKHAGDFSGTCGYTGPGIGLVLKLFQHNNIYNHLTLDDFLQSHSFTPQLFMDIINETIGNFLDVVKDCPVTDVQQGIRGLLEAQKEKASPTSMQTDEPPLVYKVEEGGINLIEGVNVISFTTRENGCDTFHHAALYTIPEYDICFIIDSWATNAGGTFECRPLTSKQFSLGEVIRCIDRLNSDDISPAEMRDIFGHYFMAHPTFLPQIATFGRFTVSTLSPKYIEEVYSECEKRIRKGQTKSDFGGKLHKKRNKKTRKLKSKSKNKSKNKSKK
jgi:hypothetical protein